MTTQDQSGKPATQDSSAPQTDAEKLEAFRQESDRQHAAARGTLTGKAPASAQSGEADKPVKAGDQVTDGIFTSILSENGAVMYNALKAAGHPVRKVVPRAATAPHASQPVEAKGAEAAGKKREVVFLDAIDYLKFVTAPAPQAAAAMDLVQLEYDIAQGRYTAAQVFTKMRAALAAPAAPAVAVAAVRKSITIGVYQHEDHPLNVGALDGSREFCRIYFYEDGDRSYHALAQNQAGTELDELLKIAAQPAAVAPVGDPMDWPLPCDVVIGPGKHRKGTKLRTLVARFQQMHKTLMQPDYCAKCSETIPAHGEAAAPSSADRVEGDMYTLLGDVLNELSAAEQFPSAQRAIIAARAAIAADRASRGEPFKKLDLTDYSVAVNYSNGTATSVLPTPRPDQARFAGEAESDDEPPCYKFHDDGTVTWLNPKSPRDFAHMMRKMGGACRDCGGTGMADSGGTHPWGEPAMIPCGCEQYEPLRDGVSIGLIMELVERAKKLPDISTTGPIPLTPIQIAFIAGKLNRGRAASGARDGWSKEPPTDQGSYWHWWGDAEQAPFVVSVLYSGTAKKCFVVANDTHSGKAEFCDTYGGYWMPIREPNWAAAPLADEQAGRDQQ